MRLKKGSSLQINYVHNFSQITFMKFKPKQLQVKIQSKNNSSNDDQSSSKNFLKTLKSFIAWSPAPILQKKKEISTLSRISSNVSIKSISCKDEQNVTGNTIIFLQKITQEHFLIGNQNQIDLIYVGGIVSNFIDTQSIWELNLGKAIQRIAVDTKKCYIAIETITQILIYKYDYKRIRQKPVKITGIKTQNQGMYLRFVKDSILAVFYKNFMDVYCIQDNKMRKKMAKQFRQANDMDLFQVPNAIENCLNVFFIKKSKTSKTFQLWYIQVSFIGQQSSMNEIMKVYDIKQGLQTKIRLQNYSKQIFLMNLGFQILAVKKGYIIDSAFLNIQQYSTFLYYIGNNRLLHLSPLKAEIYEFKINFNMNPPRIQIKSLDSIQIKKPLHFQYVGALQMLDKNFAVFYQILPKYNRRTQGQIKYCFAITRHISIQEKIKQIFTFTQGVQVKDVGLQIIQERIDMARKIGLSRVQTYLQLWNRTKKSDIEQFNFLLDTLDYGTIKKQIEKKLKKSSMLFRQIYKIQQSCFQMIKNNLFSFECSQNVIQQYLSSHFLLRKLQLYRDITMHQKVYSKKRLPQVQQQKNQQNSDDALKINIQNYNKYLKADIKVLILQLIQQYCYDNKNNIMHIRLLLKSFRFVIRIIYKQLLEQIVMTAKNSLIKLLENMPELLPYKHILNDHDDISLYQGIWQEISRTQWDKNIYIQSISTIDNRQIVSQIIKSLWFRRNFLTQHDMTQKSKQQIIKIHQQNNSDQIFYFFISKVFHYIKQQQSLQKITKFIQKTYQNMPEHLSQKIFLYRRIYEYFINQPLSKNNNKLTNFKQLLKMKDYQLFDQFFQFQKIKKGFLLKDMKKIYQDVGGKEEKFILSRKYIDFQPEQYHYDKQKILGQGITWFNQGILSYFSSQLSEVSDLKYILNRINSQKRQFHSENQHLIHVLVQAVKLKLRIGSDHDVPIQQVLVYLEGIPINEQNPVLQQLIKIQKINEQAQRFRQIKLNMTIAEIIENCQNVINLLIDNQIKKRSVFNMQSFQQMQQLSYDIIAQIQIVKQKIYKNQYSDLAFFVYLTKIMEQIHMIPYAAHLLQNQHLIKYYSVDMKVVQDLILYMYKMKLTNNPKYIQNQIYLNQLLMILPEDNQCYIYIKCQLEYAKILSSPDNAVEYPLTGNNDGISIVQLERRVAELDGYFLLQIDIQRLHYLMNKMQQICYQDTEDNFYTTLNQIYQVIILKLINDNKIQGAIHFTKTLIQLPNNPYAVVFPLFFIDILSKQLTVQCNKKLLKSVSYLFNQPKQILKIVQQLIGKVFSNTQRDQYFTKLALTSSQMRKNYNPKNPILDSTHLQVIRNQQMQKNFRQIVEQCGHHIIKNKDQFNNFQFSLLFIILTQQPYALGKYIYCKRFQLNYKVIRSFLSYVIKQQIFDSLNVLQFGRRIFNIICETSQSMLPLEKIAGQYSNILISDMLQFQELEIKDPVTEQDDNYIKKVKILETKLIKCIQAFDRKKSLMLNEPKQNIELKIFRIEKKLANPIQLSQQAPSQYPFHDSDDDYQQEQKIDDLKISSKHMKKKSSFNPQKQRNLLSRRNSKNFALFMSSQIEQNSFQNQMYLSTRNQQKRKLRHTKTLMFDQSNQLGFSQAMNFDNNYKSLLYKSNLQKENQMMQHLTLTQSIANYDISKSDIIKVKRNKQIGSFSPNTNPINHGQKSLSNFSQEQNLKSYRNMPMMQNQRFQSQNYIQRFEPEQIAKKFSRDYKQEQKKQNQKHKQFQLYHQKKLTKSQPPQQFQMYQQQQQQGQVQQQYNQQGQRSDQFNLQTQNYPFKVFINQVNQNDYIQISRLKQIIFDSIHQNSQKQFYVNLTQLSLQQDKQNNQSFNQYLNKLINSIYHDDRIDMRTKLKIIKQIQGLYPDIGISKQYLQIYLRFESYHTKYQISIPMTQMFPIQFIYSQFKDAKKLFDKICPIVVKLVDQSNIYKISKIIHLAFKATSFQNQFFFSYLCIAAQKFDQEIMEQSQLNMFYEKISALIQKLPVLIIIQKGSKIVKNMTNNQKKNNLIQSMKKYIRKKKTQEEVNKFQNLLKR